MSDGPGAASGRVAPGRLNGKGELLVYDYTKEFDRCVLLFDSYLKKMVQRRSDEPRRDCAITFRENNPDGSDTPSLEEAAAKSLELALAAEVEIGGWGDQFLDQTSVLIPTHDHAAAGPGDFNGDDRYVQFAFTKRTFYLDLPNCTLFPLEAERLIRERSGFFYLKDHRQPWMSMDYWQNTVRDFSPVQKIYLNSDTRSAAEDMAYIFYTLWKFPTDWQFYYRALVFHGRKKRDWEGEGPVK
jgi:hypothetical protein